MNKLLSPGVIAGVLGAAASIATAYGATDVAHAFSDPAAGTEVLAIISVVSSLVAGFLPSHRKPVA